MKGISPGYACLGLSGRDAKDFAHRLTTVNFQRLQPGSCARGLLLSGTAKVLASFVVLCLARDKYYFLGPEADTKALHAEFERLHFAEDLQMAPVAGNTYALRADQLPWQPSPWSEFAPFSGVGETLVFPWVWGEGLVGTFGAAVFPVSDDQSLWEESRIRGKVPLADKEWIRGESNALDVGFGDWIHEGKGCYPGQEVVERSLRVGHPAKALVCLSVPQECQAGDLLTKDGASAKVTSAAGGLALAVVPWKWREPDMQFLVQRGNESLGEALCRK